MNDDFCALDFWYDNEVNIISDLIHQIWSWYFCVSIFIVTHAFSLSHTVAGLEFGDACNSRTVSVWINPEITFNGYEWWSWCVRLLITFWRQVRSDMTHIQKSLISVAVTRVKSCLLLQGLDCNAQETAEVIQWIIKDSAWNWIIHE